MGNLFKFGDHVLLDEYQSYEPRHRICLPFHSNRCNLETKLFVVFNGETQRHFSSVRLVVYCDISYPIEARNALAIQQIEHVTDSDTSGDHSHHAPQNDPALPQLTLAFKLSPRNKYKDQLSFPSLEDKLCYQESKSVFILLESKQSMTRDTISVSVAFEHSNRLLSPSVSLHNVCEHYLSGRATVRTVRVLPVDGAHPRIVINCLPMEILMEIFESCGDCMWQRDLLTFAQVCRKWSRCCMKLLFARLDSPEWENCCGGRGGKDLDTCVTAKAFINQPAIGLGVQHLDIDHYNAESTCHCRYSHWMGSERPRFGQELIAILSATKNLRRLHLSLGYSSETRKIFSALPKFPHLHTLSIRLTTGEPGLYPCVGRCLSYSANTTQLARCMAQCPALTSLTAKDIKPGDISIRQILLRPRPACALTHLCIRKSHMSDKDLLYLTASSAKTLARVTLDEVSGITNNGLYVFLDAISPNVTSLTVWDIHCFDVSPPKKEVLALDAVVDKMWRLETLNISGAVASERMLRRRSELFVKNGGSDVPVVRLWCYGVPEMWSRPDREWAGWEMIEVR